MLSKGRIALFSYGIMSIAITLFNKAVLSSYHFSHAMFLTLCQSSFTLFCLVVLKRIGWIQYEDFDINTAKKVAPLSIIFLAYVVISLSALGAVNVPMFAGLRRTTILIVLAAEYLFMSKVPSKKTILATSIMTIGAIIAAMKDLTYDPVAYILVGLTNLSTAGYTVSIARVKAQTNLSVFAMLFYNTVMTLPFLLAIVLASGELQAVSEFEFISDAGFLCLFACSSFMAFALNVATFYSTSLNSPLTQTVCGQLKNFLAFLLSLVLFSDYIFDPINMMGLLIGFGGGLLYAYFQYTSKIMSGKEPAASAPTKTLSTDEVDIRRDSKV